MNIIHSQIVQSSLRSYPGDCPLSLRLLYKTMMRLVAGKYRKWLRWKIHETLLARDSTKRHAWAHEIEGGS